MTEIAVTIWSLGIAWLCFSFIKTVLGYDTRRLNRRLEEIKSAAAPHGYIFRVANGEFDDELLDMERQDGLR